MTCTDRELIDRCLQGDEEAWSTLEQWVRRLVNGLAAIHWQDPSNREEIVQEVQVELLGDQCRALRQFDGRSRLTTYLGAIVIRVAARWQQVWALEVPDPPELTEGFPDGLARQFATAELWVAIQQILSPAEVIILRLGSAGYTSEEIADALSHLLNRPWTAGGDTAAQSSSAPTAAAGTGRLGDEFTKFVLRSVTF